MSDMNVILVVFDTLRKDCLGAYGAPPWGRVHTPHLDRFAAESVKFTRAPIRSRCPRCPPVACSTRANASTPTRKARFA